MPSQGTWRTAAPPLSRVAAVNRLASPLCSEPSLLAGWSLLFVASPARCPAIRPLPPPSPPASRCTRTRPSAHALASSTSVRAALRGQPSLHPALLSAELQAYCPSSPAAAPAAAVAELHRFPSPLPSLPSPSLFLPLLCPLSSPRQQLSRPPVITVVPDDEVVVASQHVSSTPCRPTRSTCRATAGDSCCGALSSAVAAAARSAFEPLVLGRGAALQTDVPRKRRATAAPFNWKR